MTDSLASLVDYMRWADRRIVAACRDLTAEQFTREIGGSFPSVHATLAHIAGAAEVWAARMEGRTPDRVPGAAEIPDLEDAARRLEAAAAVAERTCAEWSAAPDAPFSYRNTRGVATTIPRWAVIRHLVNHSTYHRGQIANMLRQMGVQPPATDLFIWAQGN